MSTEIHVQCEIRDMLIMKDVLKNLGYTFTEPKTDYLVISKRWHNLVIDGNTGQISADSVNSSEVDSIKQAYTVEWYKDRAIKEGMQFKQKTLTNGEIEIELYQG